MSNLLDAKEIMVNNVVDLGTVAANHMIKGNKEVSTYRVEWTIDKLPSPIVKFSPGCSCTAKIRQEGNKIVADYTPGMVGNFERVINVFLDDDKPLYTKTTTKEGEEIDILNFEAKKYFQIFVKGNYV